MTKTASDILRVLVALAISVAWFGVIPIYGMPFGGCATNGYLTLETGCSDWPEFFRGFGFVLIYVVIAPTRMRLHVVALCLIVVIGIAGGAAEIRVGEWRDITSVAELMRLASLGLPQMLGSLVAFGTYVCTIIFTEKHHGSV